MALLRSADYQNLPSEPEARWLVLRDLIESRLDQIEKATGEVSTDNIIEYSYVLSSAAKELGVGDLEPLAPEYVHQDYIYFKGQVVGLATKLSLRGSSGAVAISVELSRPTKEKIFSQIEKLRRCIDSSDLPEKTKTRAQSKLDELHGAVVAPRTDYAKVMFVLTIVTSTLGGATSFLADAPEAVSTITALIGKDKEAEEQKLLAETPPPKAITDYRSSSIDDDEIPF